MRLSMIVAGFVLSNAIDCPGGWREHGNKCYRLVEERTTHYGCLDLCSDGALVTVTSESTESFLKTAFLDSLAFGVWIGAYQKLNSTSPDNDWYWISGTPWDPEDTRWAPGEPDDMAGGCMEEACGVLAREGMNDVHCSHLHSCLCEWPATTTEAYIQVVEDLKAVSDVPGCDPVPPISAFLVIVFLFFLGVLFQTYRFRKSAKVAPDEEAPHDSSNQYPLPLEKGPLQPKFDALKDLEHMDFKFTVKTVLPKSLEIFENAPTGVRWRPVLRWPKCVGGQARKCVSYTIYVLVAVCVLVWLGVYAWSPSAAYYITALSYPLSVSFYFGIMLALTSYEYHIFYCLLSSFEVLFRSFELISGLVWSLYIFGSMGFHWGFGVILGFWCIVGVLVMCSDAATGLSRCGKVAMHIAMTVIYAAFGAVSFNAFTDKVVISAFGHTLVAKDLVVSSFRTLAMFGAKDVYATISGKGFISVKATVVSNIQDERTKKAKERKSERAKERNSESKRMLNLEGS